MLLIKFICTFLYLIIRVIICEYHYALCELFLSILLKIIVYFQKGGSRGKNGQESEKEEKQKIKSMARLAR